MTEVWKDVPDTNGRWAVSSDGRVKSRCRGYERMIKPIDAGKGYLRVKIKGKMVLLHRLIWETFNGPIPDGMQIGHLDEDRGNNKIENLRPMTPTENNNWGTRNDKSSKTQLNRPDCSKWVIKLNEKNEILHFYPSASQASRETGIDVSGIIRCCNGMYKYSGGFKWKYAS